MNTSRITKFIIGIFLLAALPGLTAVMAQEQVAPELPAAVPVTCNLNESEPNNSQSAADSINFGDVICGRLEYHEEEWCGPDYYKFSMPEDGYMMLSVDTAPYWNNNTVTLFDQMGNVYDLMEFERHAFIFHNLSRTYPVAGNEYFIKVENDYGEDCLDYALTLESPLLISAAAANLGTGNVAGIQFQAQDILAWSRLNNGQEKWEMFFDGSDVGVTKNITNLSSGLLDYWHENNNILISLAANQNLPGAGLVTPYDIVRFVPERYGTNTAGTFAKDWLGEVYLKGSRWSLTTTAEKIDALDSWGGCYGDAISTAGTAKVFDNYSQSIRTAQDEDLLCREFEDDDYSPEFWEYFFDGTKVPGLKGEDVFAMAYDRVDKQAFLTILGPGVISGNRVTQKDIFAINYPSYTWGGIVWRGPDHGWNYNIDAFDWNGW